MKKILTLVMLWYLRICARIQLRKIKPVIIGVGGSSGKTSLCTLIYLLLKDTYVVKQSQGKNSESGIPLDILGISMHGYGVIDWVRVIFLCLYSLFTDWKRYDVYIVELGIDSPVEPKNMSYLLKIVTPTIGVLTNISLEHSVYFDSYVKADTSLEREEKILAMTAEQENLLLTSLPASGMAIVNMDDKLIAAVSSSLHSFKTTISTESSADFSIRKIGFALNKFTMDFTYTNKVFTISMQQPLPKHFAYEFLFAIAVAKRLGIAIDKSIMLLEGHFSLPPGRMSIFDGIKNIKIIDSSYNNATLAPILDFLDLLATIPKTHRTVAILGDMRELGSMSKLIHEKVAQRLLESADTAILIGPLMEKFVAPILEKNEYPFYHFKTFTDSKSKILETIKPHDVILVKGSQNTLYLERVVEMLLLHPEDTARLCRRGKFWDEKRRISQ